MSNVGSNEKNSSDINITDVDFLFADTYWQALFDIDFELQNVTPTNVQSNPVQSVQFMPVQFNSLMEANNRNVIPAVSNYNCTVHFKFYLKWWLWFKHFYIVTLLHHCYSCFCFLVN
jgi:hypothetical protein